MVAAVHLWINFLIYYNYNNFDIGFSSFLSISTTFLSYRLVSELGELCGWQFPPGTPLRGISWGRQRPAANQKMAPSPWDQLQQLQRPRRQVVRLPHAATLRYLARAAGKLLVSCLHQGHTGHPVLWEPLNQTVTKGCRTVKRGVRKAKWKRKNKKTSLKEEVRWVGQSMEIIHSRVTRHEPRLPAPVLGPLGCVCFRLSSAICLHIHRTIIRKLPQFRAHSQSSPVLPLSKILPRGTGCNSFIAHVCFQDKHMRARLCPVQPANGAAPCSWPQTAEYHHSDIKASWQHRGLHLYLRV